MLAIKGYQGEAGVRMWRKKLIMQMEYKNFFFKKVFSVPQDPCGE